MAHYSALALSAAAVLTMLACDQPGPTAVDASTDGIGTQILAAHNGNVPVGVVKIAPRKGKPGHPFRIIDTHGGRLGDGSKAVFTPNGGASLPPVDLEIHNRYAAHAQLPLGMCGGDYTVTVLEPSGDEIEVVEFTVIAEPACGAPSGASISPTSGNCVSSPPQLLSFVITDPGNSLLSTDIVTFTHADLFFPVGTTNISVSQEGMTLTGEVVVCLPLFAFPFSNFYLVSVRHTLVEPPYITGLQFEATPF